MAPALTGGPGCSCLLVRIPSSVMLLPLRGCWHHVFATSPALSPMCWLSGLPSFTLQGSLRMSCSCPGEPAQGGDRWRLLEGPRQAPQGPKVCSGLTVLGKPGGLPPFPHQGYRLWSPISSSCPLGSHWGRGSGLQAPSQGHSHLALPWVPVCSSMHPCSPAAHQSTEGQGLRGTTQAAVRFSESNAQAMWPEGHGKG